MYSFRFKLIDFLLKQGATPSLNNDIVISIKRDDIVSALGSSRRTLFRLIKELKEENLITLEKDTIRISRKGQASLAKILDEWEANAPL